MKRRFLLPLLLLLLLALLAGCALAPSDAGKPGDKKPDEASEVIPVPGCKHITYTVTAKTEGSCTEPETETRLCSVCGETFTVTTKAAVHALVHHEGKPATCTEDGFAAYDTCEKCDYTTYRKIAAHHDLVHHEGVPATCTEDGFAAYDTCKSCDYTTYQAIPSPGHSLLHHVGLAPTETSAGYDEYDFCTVCGYSTIVYLPATHLSAYSGSFGFDSLAGQENGENKQKFYLAIDEIAYAFHTGTEDAEPDVQYPQFCLVGDADYGTLGLTDDEAKSVFVLYRADHPLYYWIATRYAYGSGELSLFTVADYAEGATRAALNATVYQKIEDFAALVSGKEDPYEIASAIRLSLFSGMTYAYVEGTKTPDDSHVSHCILGAFFEGKGVCESYAKTFHLLLTYLGVEDIYVTGKAGDENHAWNLVKLADGNYYWCDLTWDDQLSEAGAEYDLPASTVYFCVTDEQVNDYKGDTGSGSTVTFEDGTYFLEEHSPDDTYPLPVRAAEPYSPVTP